MASKVIRNVKTDSLFKMREFATVERGEKLYNLRSFADDEELSVQDMFSDTGEEEPETIEEYQDEITERDYWPPSRLAKAEEGIIGEVVELPEGKLGQGFVESPMFSDSVESEKEPAIIKSRGTDRVEDDLPAEDIPVVEQAQAPVEPAPVEENFAPIPEMAPLISEEELEALKSELESYKSQVEGALAHAEEMSALKLTVEKALMERDKQLDAKTLECDELTNTLPEKLEQARSEGKQEGFEEAKAEFEKHYEAEKADYMAKLDNFMAEALKKLDDIKASIDALDEQIPDTVIGFVKTLIGSERVINDNFALNLIKNNLSKLSEYKDISFIVNPDDLESVKAGLPDYAVESNVSIPKGAIQVNSKSGELSLNVDDMVKDLEEQIHAQLTATENS